LDAPKEVHTDNPVDPVSPSEYVAPPGRCREVSGVHWYQGDCYLKPKGQEISRNVSDFIKNKPEFEEGALPRGNERL